MEGEKPYMVRDIQLLRDTLHMLCQFVWNGRPPIDAHVWTIPVDRERDFDCILSDAILELQDLRARCQRLERNVDTSI